LNAAVKRGVYASNVDVSAPTVNYYTARAGRMFLKYKNR
jgi:hypothetical protein